MLGGKWTYELWSNKQSCVMGNRSWVISTKSWVKGTRSWVV